LHPLLKKGRKKIQAEREESLKKVEKSFADKIKVISFASAFEASRKKTRAERKKFKKKLKKVLQIK